MSAAPRVAGLLLAAGGGRRLGCAKALASFHGEPLVARGVRLLLRAGCEPIVVVVGADGGAAADVLAGGPVTIARNADWRSGMGGSLRVGLATLRRLDVDAAVVALVDQPLVDPSAVGALVAAWSAGAVIAVATYGGAPRHPVIFDARAWDAIDAVAIGDRGARDLLRARPDWVQTVPCDTRASPRDIDTEADLRALHSEPDPNPPPGGGRPVTKEQPCN